MYVYVYVYARVCVCVCVCVCKIYFNIYKYFLPQNKCDQLI